MTPPLSAAWTERLVQAGLVARCEHFATLPSTNDYLREAAVRDAGRESVLVVADAQTAGRGRGANRWWTGEGSLAASLLFDPAGRGILPRRLGMVPLAAAVAVVQAAGPLIQPHELGLHWPNDVFAAGRKLAGVLAEGLGDGRQIMGVGVNVNNSAENAPAELRATVVSIRDLTHAWHDVLEFLEAWLGRLNEQLDLLGTRPEELGRLADSLCLQKGRLVRVASGGRDYAGVCAGIAEDGAMLLDGEGGRRAIYSGVLAGLPLRRESS